MCKFKTYPSNLRRHKKDTTNRTNFTYGNVRVNLIFQRFISIRKTSNREINKHWEKLVCRVILFFSSRKLYHKVKPAGPGAGRKKDHILYCPITQSGFFSLPATGCGGWGLLSEAPLFNFKTAHATAIKTTQNNVLMISNFWA